VRRTLRDDGLLFVVVGDAYNTRSKIRPTSHQPSINGAADERWAEASRRGMTRVPISSNGLKEGDLLMLPALLALALRSDGWILRSDIIWHKTAHLPEPVRSRPTSSHEHVLMLAKTRHYFFNPRAIEEPASPASAARYAYGFSNTKKGLGRMVVNGLRRSAGTRRARDVWSVSAAGGSGGDHPAAMPIVLAERCILAACRPGQEVLDPFGGSGTTALAAARLGRLATLIELSPQYAAAARTRLGTLIR
jgi:DNA modification methylase